MQQVWSGVYQRTEPPAVSGGMRVIIVEKDAGIRDHMQAVIQQTPPFTLLASVDLWPACEAHVDQYLPELLIADRKAIPAAACSRLVTNGFPVMLWLRSSGNTSSSLGLAGLEDQEIRHALAEACSEIYRRKATELLTLLDHYLTGTMNGGGYVTSLTIERAEGSMEIAADSILSMSAAGNYVRVHTATHTYEIRDTMTGIYEKLDPASFSRVHRCHVVNLSQVAQLIEKDSIPSTLIMSNGVEIPIGPNYRAEVASLFNGKLQHLV